MNYIMHYIQIIHLTHINMYRFLNIIKILFNKAAERKQQKKQKRAFTSRSG